MSNVCVCKEGRFDELGWCDNCGGEHLDENWESMQEEEQ